mmetsp:Transcript_69385/g.194060  ORF Transcript_69385/g.194060 Transcript_69385/m.194060 type:complete len:85 (+) Transcript_69385:400-654(+)
MMMVVLPSAACLRSCTMSASVAASRALVASSQNKIGESLSMARAIPTRCFSPPDSFSPRSPTRVSNPSGILATNRLSLHASTAR